MVIADNVALHVNHIFAEGAALDNSALVWWGALCFGIQIYCDFSDTPTSPLGLHTFWALSCLRISGLIRSNLAPGLLEEVAYLPLNLAQGLPVHPFGRQQEWGSDDGIRTDDDHASGRAMGARSLLEFCDLGILARNSPSNQQVPLVERNDIVLIL